MPKAKTQTSAKLPAWVQNLRHLMEEHGFNPRSLSLKAGLNATAVRDMLEGRSRFPRYDTAQALAAALNTTPARLMSDEGSDVEDSKGGIPANDLELLTEIIARLQEEVEELNRKLSPRDFAAITATIYKRLQDQDGRSKGKTSAIRPQIHDLLDYENLRQKRARRT